MSMPRIETPENPINRNQSVSNLIESVALMETGLSHILNAEGEKLQKVIKVDDPTAEVPIEDILRVNESVERMVNTVSKLEMILQNKLDISKDLDEEVQPDTDIVGTIIPYSGIIGATTLVDGGSETGASIAFQNGSDLSQINFNGNVDVITVNDSIAVYPMSRAGVLTGFSAFFELLSVTTGLEFEKQIVAKIYRAEPNSTTYNAIEGTTINLTPVIPANISSNFRINGSLTNLNVSLEANTKILIVFYCLTESGIVEIRGIGGASINIK